MKLKDGLALLREYVNEVEPNESFMQQLADYDLDLLSKNKFGKWVRFVVLWKNWLVKLTLNNIIWNLKFLEIINKLLL